MPPGRADSSASSAIAHAAPDENVGEPPEAEPAPGLARPHLEGDEQAVAGALEGRGLDGGRDRGGAVVGKIAALDLRLQHPVDLGERHVDRNTDRDAAAI